MGYVVNVDNALVLISSPHQIGYLQLPAKFCSKQNPVEAHVLVEAFSSQSSTLVANPYVAQASFLLCDICEMCWLFLVYSTYIIRSDEKTSDNELVKTSSFGVISSPPDDVWRAASIHSGLLVAAGPHHPPSMLVAAAGSVRPSSLQGESDDRGLGLGEMCGRRITVARCNKPNQIKAQIGCTQAAPSPLGCAGIGAS
jgi:hypothetical protein